MNGLIKWTSASLVIAMSTVGCATITDSGSIVPAPMEASATRDQFPPTHGSEQPAHVNPVVRDNSQAYLPYSYHNQLNGHGSHTTTTTTTHGTTTREPSVVTNNSGNTTVANNNGSTQNNGAMTNNGNTTNNHSLAHDPPSGEDTGDDSNHIPMGHLNGGGLDSRMGERTSSDNMSQITFTRVGADFDIDVEPTGKFLVYASTRNNRSADIYIKGIASSTMTQFTNDPANDVMPAYSPDGRWIAFSSDRNGNWDIFVKHVNGNKAIQLTNSASHELHPTWHPNGGQIVFSALNEQSGDWEMVIVDVDKPNNRKYIGKGLFPEFSPNGKKLLYQRARERGSRLFGIWTLDIINGQGVHPTEIMAARNSALMTPTWSYNGEQIAFISVVNPPADPEKRPSNTQMWVCNANGTNRINMTNDRYVNLQPVWGKGDVVYFVSDRTGNDNIWSMPVMKSIIVTGGEKVEFKPPTPSEGAITIQDRKTIQLPED